MLKKTNTKKNYQPYLVLLVQHVRFVQLLWRTSFPAPYPAARDANVDRSSRATMRNLSFFCAISGHATANRNRPYHRANETTLEETPCRLLRHSPTTT